MANRPKSAAVGEFREQGHAAVDEQGLAIDVVGIVGGEPHRGLADIDRLADPLVGDQLQQRFQRLGRLPRRTIDRGGDGARSDRVDADFLRRPSEEVMSFASSFWKIKSEYED